MVNIFLLLNYEPRFAPVDLTFFAAPAGLDAAAPVPPLMNLEFPGIFFWLLPPALPPFLLFVGNDMIWMIGWNKDNNSRCKRRPFQFWKLSLKHPKPRLCHQSPLRRHGRYGKNCFSGSSLSISFYLYSRGRGWISFPAFPLSPSSGTSFRTGLLKQATEHCFMWDRCWCR